MALTAWGGRKKSPGIYVRTKCYNRSSSNYIKMVVQNKIHRKFTYKGVWSKNMKSYLDEIFTEPFGLNIKYYPLRIFYKNYYKSDFGPKQNVERLDKFFRVW